MSLYFWLLAISFAGPFALSFDRKVAFYKHFKTLLPSIGMVAAVYIAFDVYFTKQGIWGFNPLYHNNIIIAGLPLEEWLFFLVVPYASIFIHYCIVAYFPSLMLSLKATRIVAIVMILFLLVLAVVYWQQAYTLYMTCATILALTWGLLTKGNSLGQYFISFIVILIPFIGINSILTGSFIDEPVVWYNNAQNLSIRFMTIPIEDFGYGFSLILFSILTNNLLNKKLKG
jgi:lycopene cyclase domain-containing protein